MRRRFALEATLVFLFSCMTMFIFRFDGLWNVDDTGYLSSILNGSHSSLGLGRPGYVYPYYGMWLIFQKFVSTNIYQYMQFIRFTNVVISGIFVVAVYGLLMHLTQKKFLAAVTAVLFCTTSAFLDFVSWIGSDQLMYCSIALSYWAFILAFQKKSAIWLYLSMFLLGYAFEVREPAVLLLGFFPLYLGTRNYRTFPHRTYATAALVLLLVASLGPLILLWKYQTDYLSAFLRNVHVVRLDREGSFWERAEMMFHHQIFTPRYMTVPVVLGSLIGFWRPHLFGLTRARFLFFWTILLAPTVALIMLHSQWALLESRFALPIILTASFSVGICLEGLRRWSLAVPIVLLVFLVAGQFQLRWGVIQELKQLTAASQAYYERVKPFLNRDSVLLIGAETYIVKLRAQIENLSADYIDPGWNWPGNLLESDVRAYLSGGQKVIYDPMGSWYEYNLKDINSLREKFIFEALPQGFISIKNRSD